MNFKVKFHYSKKRDRTQINLNTNISMILARPPCPEEKQHKLRMIYGNGLRPQIWKEFVRRFNVMLIYLCL